MNKEQLIKRRDKRVQELKDCILNYNQKAQELKETEITRERLTGTIAEINEQIQELDNNVLEFKTKEEVE